MSLESIIRKRITANNGAISVADYMELALSHPKHGYYIRKDPLGVGGDFTTAPEISQIFGELIGAFMASQWQAMGAPVCTLVELGPGRGTLMADALRGTKNVPEFHNALSIQLVETSPALRLKQKETLAGVPHLKWQSQLDLPPRPVLLIANEFFDALPIRQFIREGKTLRERMIRSTDGRFIFTPEGDVTAEHCQLAIDIVTRISRHIHSYGGVALIIDYGYSVSKKNSVGGDTLQALKNHRFHDPLIEPGTADLTAHVDFDALKKAAASGGATVHGPVTQGNFLTRLGIGARAEMLCAKATPKQKIAIVTAVERLISIDKMGDLFKVIVITSQNQPKPEGF